MSLPSRAVELANSIDYMQYVSPDADVPEKGFLAVEAVKLLAPYIRNFVLETPNSVMVPPPNPIQVPSLQTFTFMAVTGRVIARTILGADSSTNTSKQSMQSMQSTKSQSPTPKKQTLSGPGSSSGSVPPPKPKSAGKRLVNMVASDEDDASADDDADDDGDEAADGDDDDGDLEALERLEKEVGSKKSKLRGKPAGKPAKKKAKTQK